MVLIRKHFQITKEQSDYLLSKVKPGVSESDIVRMALDEHIEKDKQKEGESK